MQFRRRMENQDVVLFYCHDCENACQVKKKEGKGTKFTVIIVYNGEHISFWNGPIDFCGIFRIGEGKKRKKITFPCFFISS